MVVGPPLACPKWELVGIEMDDPYFAAVQEQWSNIRMLYRRFGRKKPIMLFDIEEQRIYAYPLDDFLAELSERSQIILEEQYKQALVDRKIVVFVRDNIKRMLVSYAVDETDIQVNQGAA